MRSQDLHDLLAAYRVDHPDDVLDVDDELSADQDVTGLIWELAASGRDPVVVCRNVTGLGVELVTNVFASRARLARLLGTDERGLHAEFQRRAARPLEPRELPDGPVLDGQASGPDVDLATVPMIRHFESDSGPYITTAVVIAEDPETGGGNCSYHRSTVAGRNRLATSLHSRGHLWRMLQIASERGETLPVALVIGGHPLFLLACSARTGFEVDERAIAGGLFGEPLEVVRTPRHGIRVPATSDFVLEGHIDPEARADEGPFGEFSGYSSSRSTNNVLTVETILRRRDPVLLDVAGGQSAEHLNLARLPREAEMAAALRQRFPDVTALHYPTSGTHFHAYVALRQRMPGQARQVALALMGWDPYLKVVVAVDDDIDVADDSQVLWAMATRAQPREDVFMVDGLPGSPLDPSSSASGTTSRMGIDATRGAAFDARRIEIADHALERARQILNQAR